MGSGRRYGLLSQNESKNTGSRGIYREWEHNEEYAEMNDMSVGDGAAEDLDGK
jgi:hypothetical protein